MVSPSHYKITVKTITCGISICKSKSVNVVVDAGGVEKLVEERKESLWVRFRAHTKIKITNVRVSHVTLVIGSVKVDAIPARGEVHLPSGGVAFKGREPVGRTAVATNAIHVNGSMCAIAVVEGSSCRITSNHPEADRESQRFGKIRSFVVALRPSRSVIASPELIVYRRTTIFHHLPHFVRSLVVQLRNPVVTVVERLVASGLSGLEGIRWSHGALEGVTSNDVMDVSSWNTRIYDGVRSLNGKRCAVQSKDALSWDAGSERYEDANHDKESKEWLQGRSRQEEPAVLG